MKKFLTLFFLLTYTICSSQNLVSNPSFENYDSCPDFYSQINRAMGWYSTRNTPDYFNTCSPYYPHPYTCVNVPSNSFGYRTPASGNAYSGAITKEATDEERETMGSQLITSLLTGTRYYVSFKVSLAGNSGIYQWCGINKIGMLFSTVKYDSASPSPICSNCAQICSNSIITDTLNWTRINGSFVADSNYSYISLGRFNYNAQTDSIQLAGTDCYAYYYFDDICVSDDSSYVYNYTYTGIENNYRNNSADCFPNPFFDKLNFQSPGNNNTELYLYDILSRQLLHNTFVNSTTIETEQLPAGIYIYELLNKKGIIKKGKVIKQ